MASAILFVASCRAAITCASTATSASTVESCCEVVGALSGDILKGFKSRVGLGIWSRVIVGEGEPPPLAGEGVLNAMMPDGKKFKH